LLSKKSRLSDNLAFGPDELGKFNRYDDPGIRWKHVASIGFTQTEWNATFTQRYTGGYTDAVLPGVENGTVKPPNLQSKVSSYTVYDLNFTYTAIKKLELSVGLKNLFDTNPPFSAYYDADLGSGSSWDPRVADPRGRSLTLGAKYSF